MEMVHVLDHPLLQHKLSILRDETTGVRDFREIVGEIATLMCYDATRNLPLEPVEVQTPVAKAVTYQLAGKKLAIVPVLRAGLGMVEGILTLIPSAKVGHIGLFRDPETLEPVKYYCKMPTDIAERDASERIIIGGQEEVEMGDWENHPDYLTCGHIHKRQHIWNTRWARYTGSVLPMSFAEKDYRHGVDLVTTETDGRWRVDFLEYEPQHPLRILPETDEAMSPKKLQKITKTTLPDRVDGLLGDDFVYLVLKVKTEKASNDEIKALHALIETKNAVLCKTQRVIDDIDLTTMTGQEEIHSIDDILNRDPLETLKETFAIKHNAEMTAHQEQMLRHLIETIHTDQEKA